MPIYEYHCERCQKIKEVFFRSFGRHPIVKCDNCNFFAISIDVPSSFSGKTRSNGANQPCEPKESKGGRLKVGGKNVSIFDSCFVNGGLEITEDAANVELDGNVFFTTRKQDHD